MALISFVVPAYRVQGYLRECLDSICGQAGAEIEVIGVDDGSPDSSGEILAEYARRDPRVRVVTLPVNRGLGAARNAGLAEARGEYVWFVDGDDWLAGAACGRSPNGWPHSAPTCSSSTTSGWTGAAPPAAAPCPRC